MTSSQKKQSTQFTIPRWLPYVVFALATVVFFKAQIGGSAFFWDDFAEYVYPVRAFAAHHMSQGVIPFWNPYSFCGMPFQADVQSALFYPPNLILDMISGSSGAYPILNLQILIVLHYFLAQCSMYILARSLKISTGGSMIAALSYGFSAPLVLHAFHPMQLEHLAWFPLVTSAVLTAVRRRSILHASMGGLVMGMMMLSGSPQMTLYMAFSLGLMILWMTVWSVFEKKSTIAQAFSSFGIGLIPLFLGLGIFCVQYLPVREIAALSERAEISYEKASVGSLEAKQLLCTTVPKAFGSISPESSNKAPFFLHDRDYYLYWDTAFFFGAVAFILGLFGALNGWRKREVAMLIALAVFAFLFALGSNGFVFPIFFELPFFNALRIPARMMFLFAFAFCLLAGYGFDFLYDGTSSNRRLYTLVGSASLPAIFALVVATGSGVDIPAPAMESTIHGFGTTALLIVAACFVLMFLVYKDIVKPNIALWPFLLLIFINLYSAHADFNNGKTNPVKESQSMLSDDLKAQLLPHPPGDIFRVSMRAPGVMALKRNQGMTDGVMLYEGYNQLLLAKRHPEVGDIKRMLDMLGVKYEIGIDSVRRSAGFRQRPDYYPNAWMVYGHRDASESSIRDVMKDTTIDYHSVAVFDSTLNLQLSNKKSAEVEHSVHCDEYKDNYTRYTVSTSEAGILCFSEIWYPAWNVYVDGKKADALRADYCFRAVALSPGKHIIEWRFESQSFQHGMLISLGSLATCVALLVVALFLDRRKGASALVADDAR